LGGGRRGFHGKFSLKIGVRQAKRLGFFECIYQGSCIGDDMSHFFRAIDENYNDRFMMIDPSANFFFT